MKVLITAWLRWLLIACWTGLIRPLGADNTAVHHEMIAGILSRSGESAELFSHGGEHPPWPAVILDIKLPSNDMPTFGSRVPFQVSLSWATAWPQLLQNACHITFSDAATGSATMTTNVPLSVAYLEANGSMEVSDSFPGFSSGLPSCVGTERRLCKRAFSVPGPRRTYVCVECRQHPPSEGAVTLASAHVDYFMSRGHEDHHPQRESTFTLGVDGSTVAIQADETTPVLEQAEDFCRVVVGMKGSEVQACTEFVSNDIAIRDEGRFHAHVASLLKYLEAQGHDLGFMEGSTYLCPQKLRLMREVVQRRRPRRICEIGFNAGHSALLWLLFGGSDTTVLSFDLGEHAYSHQAAGWILEHMGRRLEVVMGSSHLTVPAYATMHPDVRCDVVMIDGGHGDELPLLDMRSMVALANRTDHVVLMDDSDMPDVQRAIEVMTQEGQFEVLEEVTDTTHPVVYQKTENTWDVYWQRAYATGMGLGRFVYPHDSDV